MLIILNISHKMEPETEGGKERCLVDNMSGRDGLKRSKSELGVVFSSSGRQQLKQVKVSVRSAKLCSRY